MTRRLALLLTLLAFALVPAGPVAIADDHDEGASGTNAAVAVNETDGSSVFDLAFSIRQVAGDVVEEQNVAVAYASCTDCRTVAIAIQIVLVVGDPEVVTPENVAVAVNELCQTCVTLAAAYQIVLGTGERVRLTGRGRREIARIRRQLEALGRDGSLSAEELAARVRALVGELKQVLATELVPVRDDDEDEDEEEDEREDAEDTGEPAPTPTPTATPAPAPESGATPTPTPEATPTATPEATATPEPTP